MLSARVGVRASAGASIPPLKRRVSGPGSRPHYTSTFYAGREPICSQSLSFFSGEMRRSLVSTWICYPAIVVTRTAVVFVLAIATLAPFLCSRSERGRRPRRLFASNP